MTEEKKPQIQELPIGDVIPTSDNPRVIRSDDPTVRELAESFKGMGVLQPVIVRPHPSKPGKYDLRAGGRRFAAAKLAGLERIPAIVRELDDAEAVKVTVLENLQREDLTPIEEGRAVQLLLDGGADLEQTAAHVGKSRSWVLRRAQLSKLSKSWTKAATNRKDAASAWPAGHLELIARLPEDVQERFFDTYFQSWRFNDGTPPSLASLEQCLAHELHFLRKARWNLDEGELVPECGACASCTKRSSVHPGLFEERQTSRNDRCLDGECWDLKVSAHVERRLFELKLKHKRFVLLNDGQSTSKYREAIFFTMWAVKAVKKSDKKALPALFVVGPRAGEFLWVELLRQREEKKTSMLAEKRKRLQERREAHVYNAVKAWLDKLPFEKLSKAQKKLIVPLVAAFGISFGVGIVDRKPWKEYAKALGRDARGFAQLWHGLREQLKQELTPTWYSTPIVTADKLSGIFGFKFAELVKAGFGSV